MMVDMAQKNRNHNLFLENILIAMMMKSVLILGMMVFVILFLCGETVAQSRSATFERSLLAAMSSNEARDGRLIEPGVAIREGIRIGLLTRRPNRREDYTDYRVARFDARIFGLRIIVVEEEYMARYVGCCVSPGIGVILELTGSQAEALAFAERNGCRIENNQAEIRQTLGDLNVSTAYGRFIRISCRERDLL